MSLVETNCYTNDRDEELADQHAQSSVEKNGSSTELLNSVERDRCRADVDQGEDQRDQERVANGAGRLQERSGVVENEVNTSPLLHHLQRSTKDGSSQVRLLVTETTLEAVGPASEPAGGWDELSLVFLVGDDFGNLSLNVFGLSWLASKSAQSSSSGLDVSSLDVVSWGIWQEEETDSQDKTPGELDADRDSV